ncbi:MAG: cyanophycinase [Acidobacteria bacterium]|nr:cyanophycinase [Acidobacteriota bacterium]
MRWILLLGLGVALYGGRGQMVLIGGGPKPEAAMTRFVQAAGGAEALILIVPTASELADTGEFYCNLFKELGCKQVVALDLAEVSDASDEENLALVARCGGIFFAGGDQRRITAALLNTPLLEELRRAFERGCAIGGTSAGTACMSRWMITGDGDFDRITAENVVVTEGLGLFPHAILDQHFVARQRQNRLIAAVLERPELLGIGIDEGTAVWLKEDLTLEVIGEGWVVVYDASDALAERQGLRWSALNLKVHIMVNGQQFHLPTRRPIL